MSRVPRKIMSRHGASFNWVGATVSSARGGRKPHAPKSKKNLFKKINKKEMLIAFNSAFSGNVEESFVFKEDVLKMRSKDFYSLLEKVYGSLQGIVQEKKVRAGKGKLRGRKYKKNVGLLFVIGKKEDMKRKGVDVVHVNDLVIGDVSPNGKLGRKICYTENAIKEIGEVFK